jgi:hypothetical protein
MIDLACVAVLSAVGADAQAIVGVEIDRRSGRIRHLNQLILPSIGLTAPFARPARFRPLVLDNTGSSVRLGDRSAPARRTAGRAAVAAIRRHHPRSPEHPGPAPALTRFPSLGRPMISRDLFSFSLRH